MGLYIIIGIIVIFYLFAFLYPVDEKKYTYNEIVIFLDKINKKHPKVIIKKIRKKLSVTDESAQLILYYYSVKNIQSLNDSLEKTNKIIKSSLTIEDL